MSSECSCFSPTRSTLWFIVGMYELGTALLQYHGPSLNKIKVLEHTVKPEASLITKLLLNWQRMGSTFWSQSLGQRGGLCSRRDDGRNSVLSLYLEQYAI